VKLLPKLVLAALVAGGAVSLDAQAPAEAGVALSISIGDYNYHRTCSYYYRHHLPAPRRCYTYMRRYWGPAIYIDGDFIFRDRSDWGRWRNRDDYYHWKHREYRRDQWRNHRGHRDHH
jgi:hypothetical protein